MSKSKEISTIERLYSNNKGGTTIRMITFPALMEFGKQNCNGRLSDGGFPLSFTYAGIPFTHEEDRRYIGYFGATGLCSFTDDDCLVFDGPDVKVCGFESFMGNHTYVGNGADYDIHTQKAPDVGAMKVDLGFAPHEVGDEIKRRAAHLIEFLEAHSEMDTDRIKRASDKIEEACMLAVRAVSRKKN